MKNTSPEPTNLQEELLLFFKAMADANRLKIIGLLASQSLSVEQMAAMLKLRPSTVSNHLAFLSHVGLVSARAEGYYNMYSLEQDHLQAMARRLLAHETLPAMAGNVDQSAYERKVVADFSLPDGRLKTIPAQRKKLEAVLHHIIKSFQPGVHYSEKEVNEILARFHADTATLRRELVGNRLLNRQGGGGDYWRVTEAEKPSE
ncbi:MAG: metalloregulator ArsR/SmtB family transcription factor [Anaerolineales bacterium]|nr:metalloregulator ArsR/SmtB family transcription factor [Anaerolineales bacterium]